MFLMAPPTRFELVTPFFKEVSLLNFKVNGVMVTSLFS